MKKMLSVLLGLLAVSGAVPAIADYSRLWLSYDRLPETVAKKYVIAAISGSDASAVLINARNELLSAVAGLTGHRPPVQKMMVDGAVVLGTFGELKGLLSSTVAEKVSVLNGEGFLLQTTDIKDKKVTLIVSKTDVGVLYGVFHFIRLMQTQRSIDSLSIIEEPKIDLRMLNHWDNLDRSVERGYAGRSLWKFEELPENKDPRYTDYARYCASLGLNGAAINNVNADATILTDENLKKIKVLADVFREWGITLYLSANFSAPVKPSLGRHGIRGTGIGDLDTADPQDPIVQDWWKKKVADIYELIPDFGGFVVKANSEGMLGPKTYGRSHVDGANMFADVLKPYGGIILWRAFVYGGSNDRTKDAYREFKPLDGMFRENVFLQVKNGPIDFQPCEPFSPLFGAVPKTQLALELQITKEYLGQSTTLTYLGPMWRDVLDADIYGHGESVLADVVDGTLGQERTCMAGVANTGDGYDWCGNVFNQANWYAFGRLAWNPRLTSEEIADEWISMTFNCDAETRKTINQMMQGSYDANVDYSMPLGLTHIFEKGSHYGPGPAAWPMYHHADKKAVGIDRTKRGTDYAGQYSPDLQVQFNDIDQTPLKYLLWFHRVEWDTELSSGRTLWEELNNRYNRGVSYVDQMVETWKTLEGKVDPEIHASVLGKLKEEQKYARHWRRTCLDYFSRFAIPTE
ncbi:alpha-glucuronidase [Verrucomicrobia bacterium S94]|nr:alpha-glucuronidase [Verrucomicrobia bacterium S94]